MQYNIHCDQLFPSIPIVVVAYPPRANCYASSPTHTLTYIVHCVYVYAPTKTVTLRLYHHSHYEDITPSSACALDGFSGGVRQMRRRGNWECQTKSHAKCGGRGAPVVWLPVCRHRRLVDNTRRVSHPLFSIVSRYAQVSIEYAHINCCGTRRKLVLGRSHSLAVVLAHYNV